MTQLELVEDSTETNSKYHCVHSLKQRPLIGGKWRHLEKITLTSLLSGNKLQKTDYASELASFFLILNITDQVFKYKYIYYSRNFPPQPQFPLLNCN